MAYKSAMYKIGDIWYRNITKYVDIETGEEITKTKAENKQLYIQLKTVKNATTGNKPYYTIWQTRECKRNPQTRLEFS